MHKQKQSSDVFIDPVCMMNVSSGSPDIKSTYKIKTYHFCAEGCKKKFGKCDKKDNLNPILKYSSLRNRLKRRAGGEDICADWKKPPVANQ